MNKKIVTVAASLIIAACGGSESSTVVISDVVPDTGDAESSRIVFQPVEGVLAVPNDLLFSGTTDGTLEAPDEAEAKDNGDPIDLGDPAISLGAVDGWSTMFPMQVSVDMLEGTTIDASTVDASTVYMFETMTPPTDGSVSTCQITSVTTPGQPCGVTAVLSYGVDFVAVPGADSITVAPLQPLKPATTYVVAFAPGILDSSGAAVAASELYDEVTQSTAIIDMQGSVGSLQDAINLYEAVTAIGTGGNPLAAEDMIYTAAWTTNSVDSALVTATSILAATPPSITSTENIGGSPDVVTVEDTLIAAGLIDAALDGSTGLDAALLMQGEIVLPYYSGTPDDSEGASDPILHGWTALCDNALATAQARADGDTAVEPNNTVCSTINSVLGDFDSDTERYLTKFNPVPRVRDTPTLEVQITVPAAGSDWPIVILQHGITSRKEDMLSLAGALSANGFATFAIDHPLHGSRGLVSAALGGLEANASTRETTDYMNLAFLLAARDNLQQSMADLLGLRMAIGNSIEGSLTSADFDTSSVQFAGQSLGAMSGLGFTQLANNLDADLSVLGVELEVGRSALSVPGGGIVPLLFSSETFGGLIIDTVLAGAGLTTADAPELVDATLSSFAFAAQTVIDGADPLNHAAATVSLGTPIYMNEIVGGETVNDLPDQVIPNVSDFGGLTFGGTEPLAAFLGLQNVNAANSGETSGIVRFDQGSHASLLNGDVATTEMQSQVIGFLLGAGIVVSGDSVILGQ